MKHVLAFALVLSLGIAGVNAQETPAPIQGPPLTMGIIARVEWPSGKHLRLVDGRYVDLHDYTVIDPPGTTLRPGQHVAVRGFFAPGTREGHVTIDALAVTIINGDGQPH